MVTGAAGMEPTVGTGVTNVEQQHHAHQPVTQSHTVCALQVKLVHTQQAQNLLELPQLQVEQELRL